MTGRRWGSQYRWRPAARRSQPRIAIGAATETPRRLAGAESALAGTRAADADLGAAGDAAAAEADIKADAQRSAAYKRELLRVYVGRAVRQALSRKSGRGG
jgi:carbon-monoxide dehydrogenase medium subunit